MELHNQATALSEFVAVIVRSVLSITQPIVANLFSLKYLLMYFIVVAVTGFTFIALQRRQAAIIQGINRELKTANEFLASLSIKIPRYLAPQVYKCIFSGEKDVRIHTERKKLQLLTSSFRAELELGRSWRS